MTASAPDHALVLTAGLGTRLRPLSYVRAKPAVPVAGIPLIRRALRWLVQQGVRHVVLNLHHLPETVTAVVGDGRDLGVETRYLWEPRILGSAGGPRAALPLLGSGSFFIVNGDTLTNVDLNDLASAHRHSNARVTLAVIANPNPRHYGGAVADGEGWVQKFVSAGDPTPSYHFVGVQIAESDVFDGLALGQPASSIGGVYSELASADSRAIRIHPVDAQFLDIGTASDYLATSLILAAAEGIDPLPLGTGTHVERTARLVRTAVWNDVRIEAGSELVDCIVTDGAHVPAGSHFRKTAIVTAAERPPGSNEQRVGDLLITPLADASGSDTPTTG